MQLPLFSTPSGAASGPVPAAANGAASVVAHTVASGREGVTRLSPPIAIRTGRFVASSLDMKPGFDFWYGDGCIDAPRLLPSGSVEGFDDCDTMISSVLRESAYGF